MFKTSGLWSCIFRVKFFRLFLPEFLVVGVLVLWVISVYCVQSWFLVSEVKFMKRK
jgi:hypothetical protein